MVSTDEIEQEEDRDRGILSGPDRKWLLMDRDEYVEEHSRQYWGQRRDEVRKRLHNAILDFSLIFEHMEYEDRAAAVRVDTDHTASIPTQGSVNDTNTESGIRDGLALVMDLAGAPVLLRGSPDRRADIRFYQLFGDAWERLAWHWGYRLNHWDIDIEAEMIPYRDLEERAKAGDELTVDEQVQLLWFYRDEVDSAEAQKLLNALLFSEGGEIPTEGGTYDPTDE